MSPQLQLLPPLRPELGLYVRPGRNDHVVLQQLLVEGLAPTGFVFEARLGIRHEDLWQAAVDAGVDAVLDGNVQELWAPAGAHLSGISDVPWAFAAAAGEPQLRGEIGDALVASIAGYVKDHGFTAVLAPTHYLQGPDDSYLSVDVSLAMRLRQQLDFRGLADARLYYPVAMPAGALRDEQSRDALLNGLKSLDIDALWLRLHPFGTNASGPLALRRYAHVARHLHALNVPLVAERTGTVGVALLAINAVGGIECGVTLGERFDATRLTRPDAHGDPYSHPPLVYFEAIGQFASRANARELLSRRRVRAALGCPDSECCRGGPDDMVRDPRRHGLVQRVREVNDVAATPPHRRAREYIDTVLRRRADVAIRLGMAHPLVEKARHRLDSWHGTLTNLLEEGGAWPAPHAATGQRIRRQVAMQRPRSL